MPTHAQSAIETPKEGAFVTAAGMMLHRFAHTKAYRTLEIEGYHAHRNDPLQVQLSVNADGTVLVLNVLNKSQQAGELALDLAKFATKEGGYDGVSLVADSPVSMNTLTEMQIREVSAVLCVRKGIALVKTAPLSFAEYVILLDKPIIP
ncbi:MAG: hypothetical protein IJW70_08835 [Clostridia bacterium]|nr:hypothetical protein [Clostridia bacterium]